MGEMDLCFGWDLGGDDMERGCGLTSKQVAICRVSWEFVGQPCFHIILQLEDISYQHSFKFSKFDLRPTRIVI